MLSGTIGRVKTRFLRSSQPLNGGGGSFVHRKHKASGTLLQSSSSLISNLVCCVIPCQPGQGSVIGGMRESPNQIARDVFQGRANLEAILCCSVKFTGCILLCP